MSPEVSEQAFEEAIEHALLRDGFDARPDDATAVESQRPSTTMSRCRAATASAGRRTTTAGSA